jgi:hypothetical protein
MARTKSGEQGRTKSKTAAIDELTRGTEKLKDLMTQIEDLSREGFPYQDAVRARTELSLRETVRRIFGEKSEEYQTHKNHKLRSNHRADSATTIAILKQLVARLEQQKSDLLGVKPVLAEPSAMPRRLGGPSSPAASTSNTGGTVVDKPVGPTTTQANELPRTDVAVAAVASSASQSTPPGTDGSQGAPPRIPDSAVPATLATGTATLDPLVASPDQAPAPQHESRCLQAVPADNPGTSTLSLPREPVDVEPNISTVSVRTTPPAPAEAASLERTAPHQIEAAASALPTALSTSIEIAQSPEIPPVASEQVPPPLQTCSITEFHRETLLPSSPGAYLPPVTLTANGSPSEHVRAEGSQPADASSTDMTAASHEMPHPTESPVSVPPKKQTRGVNGPVPSADDSMAALRKVCTRFHMVARQLRLRRDYRATLEVEDEYDVQDLLYALLRLEFEEVGTEDWCPEYEKGATRTSYLLHKDRVVIVVKKTKAGITAKELAEQAKMDSTHYSGRIDCRTLVCFIYDPEGRIGNPRGLESDLTMVSDAFTLEVIIAPK